MNFLIITHVKHIQQNGQYYAYGPYVKEMNLWLRHVTKAVVVAPMDHTSAPSNIDIPYNHPNLKFVEVPEINFVTLTSVIRSLWLLPIISIRVMNQMYRASHIHLRCPGNMGLIGVFLQILFPYKKKTAKYAGNWDPNMRKIRTYNFQRSILSNTFLSRNMKVLVYGAWPSQTSNVKSFFTATYSKTDIVDTPPRSLQSTIQCLYCGYMMKPKRPLQSVQVVESLRRAGFKIELTLLGDGPETETIKQYVESNGLQNFIHLKGNVNAEEVKKHMQQSHFLTFYGHDSEGWPKVVAESMFWGCVPLVRSVSCTSYMLGNGLRGRIVEDSVESMKNALLEYLGQPEMYSQSSLNAMIWSRQFTLERFESEIKLLLNP